MKHRIRMPKPGARVTDPEAKERRDRLMWALMMRGMTQLQAAERLGANVASVNRWIDRGDPQPQPGPQPTRVTTETLAALLDVPMSALIPGADVRPALVTSKNRVVAK